MSPSVHRSANGDLVVLGGATRLGRATFGVALGRVREPGTCATFGRTRGLGAGAIFGGAGGTSTTGFGRVAGCGAVRAGGGAADAPGGGAANVSDVGGTAA